METDIRNFYAMRYAATSLAYQLAAVRMPHGSIKDRDALANGWIHKLVEDYEAAWHRHQNREETDVRAVAD